MKRGRAISVEPENTGWSIQLLYSGADCGVFTRESGGGTVH